MRQNEAQIYLLSNYQIGRGISLEEIRNQFPNLTINEISGDVYTVTVPAGAESEFEVFQRSVKFTSRPRLYGLNATQALEASNISVFHTAALGEIRGQGVIIGFVDTGIQYTNNVFKNADNTTRILAIWDQSIEGDTPPPNYDYGTYYTQEDINNALQAANPYTVVPSRDEDGHGTYIAGVAAGNDQTTVGGYVGGAPDADIIMVKLRSAPEYLREYYLAEPGVVAFAENDIIAGIGFLIEESVRRGKPLVICVGIGSNNGAHNGTVILERYLELLSFVQNIILSIGVGNESNLGHHYEGTVIEGQTNELEINVADDSTGLSAFLWATVPDKLTVSLRSPLGQVIPRIPILPDQPQTYRFNLEQTILTVTYFYPDPETGGERIEIRLKTPTPGLWTISVYGEDVVNGNFHIWLPQRGFVKENTRFLRAAPNTTVQIPATSQTTLTVGAYDYVDGSVYIGSGRGPTTAGIICPDILAPGVNVTGPNLTGGTTTYVGTSTAAAVTASAAAILMQWAVLRGNLEQMNTRIARGVLIRGATRQQGVIYPNSIEGFGRLDLRTSIANI